jgi:hypothetical protein
MLVALKLLKRAEVHKGWRVFRMAVTRHPWHTLGALISRVTNGVCVKVEWLVRYCLDSRVSMS